MDLVDLIEEKRFLGQEFLTWLWWKSEERGGSVNLPGQGDVTLVFEKHMLLEYGEGEASEKLICSGLQSEMKEARTGLLMSKKLEQARILLVRGEMEWNFTLAAAMMELRSVRLPKTEKIKPQTGDNQEEIEGTLLERIYLFEELVTTINALFTSYLKSRVSDDWQDELTKFRQWVSLESQQSAS